MTDIWLIFNDTGQFLFEVTDEKYSILSDVPLEYKATYVIKNPALYDYTKCLEYIYDIGTGEISTAEINNYHEIIEEDPLEQDIEHETNNIDEINNNLEFAIEDIITLKSDLENLTDVVNNALRNL